MMRIRVNIPTVEPSDVENIKTALVENMSERGKDHKIRSERIHRQLDSLTETDKANLRERRMPGIIKARQARSAGTNEMASFHSALGQLSSMPDRKYTAILADAAARHIKPGVPFIHVCINRLRVRYVRVARSFSAIKQILSVHKVLGGRKIMKLYVKSRDVWVLYAKFNEGYKHVADVFGLDLTNFPDYVQEYIPREPRQ